MLHGMDPAHPIARRGFLAATAAMATSGLRAGASPLTFGVVVDVQYADLEPSGSRHYRASLNKLREAATEFNRVGIAFVLDLGDTIDRDARSFAPVLDPFRTIEAPVHHVLGNHDFDVADDLKAHVPTRLGRGDRWASFAKGGFRFVLLDGTELHPLRQPGRA